MSWGTPFSAFSWSSAPMKSRFMPRSSSADRQRRGRRTDPRLRHSVQYSWFAMAGRTAPKYTRSPLSPPPSRPCGAFAQGVSACDLHEPDEAQDVDQRVEDRVEPEPGVPPLRTDDDRAGI